jgi:hypothetical protein
VRGGALFVPPSRGHNRIANASLYNELYLSDSAAGAIGETFGRFPVWDEAMLEHPRGRYAIAVFELGDLRICDLDDARTLVRLDLKPTDVITRNRAASQAWSRALFIEGVWIGVSWWSYYLPEWKNVALWDIASLRLDDVRELTIASSDVRAAADTIVRLIK